MNCIGRPKDTTYFNKQTNIHNTFIKKNNHTTTCNQQHSRTCVHNLLLFSSWNTLNPTIEEIWCFLYTVWLTESNHCLRSIIHYIDVDNSQWQVKSLVVKCLELVTEKSNMYAVQAWDDCLNIWNPVVATSQYILFIIHFTYMLCRLKYVCHQ